MPSLVATMSALACTTCVRTHYVCTNKFNQEMLFYAKSTKSMGLCYCPGKTTIITLTQIMLIRTLTKILLVSFHFMFVYVEGWVFTPLLSPLGNHTPTEILWSGDCIESKQMMCTVVGSSCSIWSILFISRLYGKDTATANLSCPSWY